MSSLFSNNLSKTFAGLDFVSSLETMSSLSKHVSTRIIIRSTHCTLYNVILVEIRGLPSSHTAYHHSWPGKKGVQSSKTYILLEVFSIREGEIHHSLQVFTQAMLESNYPTVDILEVTESIMAMSKARTHDGSDTEFWASTVCKLIQVC